MKMRAIPEVGLTERQHGSKMYTFLIIQDYKLHTVLPFLVQFHQSSFDRDFAE